MAIGGANRGPSATEYMLCTPSSIACLPNGNSIIGDLGDHRLKLLYLQRGGVAWAIRSVAGSGRKQHEDGVGREASFARINGIAINPTGASCTVIDGHATRNVDLLTGKVTTLLVIRPDQDRAFSPWGIAILPNGVTAITDHEANKVQLMSTVRLGCNTAALLSPEQTYPSKQRATGKLLSRHTLTRRSELVPGSCRRSMRPYGIEPTPNGYFAVAGRSNSLILAAKDDGSLHTLYGDQHVFNERSTACNAPELRFPSTIAVDTLCRIVVGDTKLIDSPEDQLRLQILDKPNLEGSMVCPETGANRHSQFNARSAPVEIAPTLTGGRLHLPAGDSNIALDHFGNLWISNGRRGIFVIPASDTGLGPGYNAWVGLPWSPTTICHQYLCTPTARISTRAVVLCAERKKSDESAQLQLPVLPLEIWWEILRWCPVRVLGARNLTDIAQHM